MVNMKRIVITFCCVFLQVRYSKITYCITLSASKELMYETPILKYHVLEAKAVHGMNVSLCYRSHMQVTTLKQDVIQM